LKVKVNPEGFAPEEIEKAWSQCHEEMIFVPSQKKFVLESRADKNEKLEAVRSQFESTLGLISQEAQKAQKLEKKIDVYTGGYQRRSAQLKDQIKTTVLEADQASIELQAFNALYELEQKAIPQRLDQLRKLVKQQEAREADNQTRFYNLSLERDSLLQAASS